MAENTKNLKSNRQKEQGRLLKRLMDMWGTGMSELHNSWMTIMW
jgi:hypothetical protein